MEKAAKRYIEKKISLLDYRFAKLCECLCQI